MRRPSDSIFAALNRREFIRRSGGCAALTSLPVLSTLLQLRLASSAIAAGGTNGDFKAMVCLFMFGGNDGHNLLVPYGAGPLGVGEHAGYVNVRQGLHYQTAKGVALPRADDLDVNDPEWGMALKPISP